MSVIQAIYLNPCMRSPKIIKRADVHFCFFDWMEFWGIRKIGHESTSRWSNLPPSSEMFLLYTVHRFLTLRFQEFNNETNL